VAAFLNDPLVINLAAAPVSPLPNQPLQTGTYNPPPTISNEIPVDGSTVPPPLALIEVLVN
jgi:hypothetical protein